MTQEHLQNLIERAVEKANADNNADNFIRTNIRYGQTQNPYTVSGVIDIYELPHQFRLSRLYNQLTRTMVYRFESGIDGTVRNVPTYMDEDADAKAQNQLVDILYEIITSKQLECCDIPATPTQQMIADSVGEIWNEYKQCHRNPNWVLKPHVTGDPNKVQFQMRIDGYESTVTIARYAVHEEFPEGCIAVKTTSQPLEFHSAHKGSQLDGIVMERISREVDTLLDNLIEDVVPDEYEQSQ